jgi:hypothetical protein
VPLAFFTAENVEMTEAFLENLRREPGLEKAFLYLNGGKEPYSYQGGLLALESEFAVLDAEGWPFFKMWNDGIRRSSLPLVLNNDISWPPGELEKLAQGLQDADRDVAIVYPRFDPDSRGLAGWCFAIRPEAFQEAGEIDERYKTWYGDDEMVLNLRKAGFRTQALDVQVWHGVTQSMVHRPEVFGERFEDLNLFRSRWGDA